MLASRWVLRWASAPAPCWRAARCACHSSRRRCTSEPTRTFSVSPRRPLRKSSCSSSNAAIVSTSRRAFSASMIACAIACSRGCAALAVAAAPSSAAVEAAAVSAAMRRSKSSNIACASRCRASLERCRIAQLASHSEIAVLPPMVSPSPAAVLSLLCCGACRSRWGCSSLACALDSWRRRAVDTAGCSRGRSRCSFCSCSSFSTRSSDAALCAAAVSASMLFDAVAAALAAAELACQAEGRTVTVTSRKRPGDLQRHRLVVDVRRHTCAAACAASSLTKSAEESMPGADAAPAAMTGPAAQRLMTAAAALLAADPTALLVRRIADPTQLASSPIPGSSSSSSSPVTGESMASRREAALGADPEAIYTAARGSEHWRAPKCRLHAPAGVPSASSRTPPFAPT